MSDELAPTPMEALYDCSRIEYLDRRAYPYETLRDHVFRVRVFPQENVCVDGGWVSLTPDGWLAVRAGYQWDGPSGPTFDTADFMRGSLVHDALYQLMRSGLLEPSWRKQADKEIYRCCREDGMALFRRTYVYLALRWSSTAKRSAEIQPEPRKVLEKRAP